MELMHKDVPFEKEDIQENGIFKGYGSTFGGKPDSYGDIIAHGAFAESIVKKGRGGLGVAMLYQHDATSIPGVWKSITEDSRGLKMEGQLALKTQLGADAYELLQLDALKGMSIGFDLPRDKAGKVKPDAYELDKEKNTRLLKRINLWEVSLVTFPANTRARVTGVKNFEDVKTERDLENALRESGLSKSESQYIVKLCRPSLRESGRDGIESDLTSLKTAIDGAVELIKSGKPSPVQDILDTLKLVNNMLT